jgi:adenylate cyclase
MRIFEKNCAMRVGFILRKNRGTLLIVLGIWVAFHLFVAWLTLLGQPDGPDVRARYQAALESGLLFGLLNILIELFVLRRQMRKWPLLLVLLTRTFILLVLAFAFAWLGFWVATYVLQQPASWQAFLRFHFSEYGHSPRVAVVLLILVSFITNFVWQISRTLSPERFYNYITGKYHSPREEFRVVMFLDVKDSTAIAEQLGNLKYHEFLNEFFYDLDEVIARHEGEIYQYVGDEVIVVWHKEYARYKGYAIRSFFRCRRRIRRLGAKYQQKYGFVPGFRASLHSGQVVVGEVGDTKKEIVFHGDVINTGSRILDQCKPLGVDFLVTRAVLESFRRARRTGLNWENYRLESMGAIRLRGKEEEVEVFSVEERNSPER